MAKTFLEIIDSIKGECRVAASTDLDDWIKDVINQEYVDLCANADFDELLVPEATVTITSDAQSQYDLPVDLRKLLGVEFASDADDPYWRPLIARNARTRSYTHGTPEWYYKAGNKLNIFPASLIVTDHVLRISYYKKPTALVDDTDVMEVEKLETPLIKKVVARVLRYHKDLPVQSVVENSAAISENKVQ